MSEINHFSPDSNTGLTRRNFLRQMGEMGLGAALLYVLSGCRSSDILDNKFPSPYSVTETVDPEPSATPFPTDIPTRSLETATPAVASTPEPSSAPLPKELEYASIFPEKTDITKTVGPINWTEPVSMVIPAENNLYRSGKVTFTFPHPSAVTESSWDELAPKTEDFNHWWDKEEKVMVFSGRPSAHPFLMMHAYQLKNGRRTYPAEYLRKAMDVEKQGKPNPLIEKLWRFKQVGADNTVRQADMKFVHMTELNADDFWMSLFYLDDKGKLFVDYNLAWKPDPNNPQNRIPLIPGQFRSPQHLTIATCDRGMATIATLELNQVDVVDNYMDLFVTAFLFGIHEA